MKAVIFNQSCWIYEIEDLDIKLEFEKILMRCEFSILKNVEYHFTPLGYTKIWLLGESHLALHTFPEENLMYVELSSCSESKADLFWTLVNDWSKRSSKRIFIMKSNHYIA